jgi:hypothetical protein
VPSPCGHGGGLAVGGDGMLYIADTHTLFALPAVSARSRGYWRARFVDAGWDMARHLPKWSRPALPLHGGDPSPAVRRRDARGVPGRIDADYPRPCAGRGDWSWGTLDRLDPSTGAPQRRYDIAPGAEGIAFGSAGQLWAVSSAVRSRCREAAAEQGELVELPDVALLQC